MSSESTRKIGRAVGELRTASDIRYGVFKTDAGAVDRTVPAELRIGEEEFSHYAAGLNNGLRAVILPVMANGSSFTHHDVAQTLQVAARDSFRGRDIGVTTRDSLVSLELFDLVASDTATEDTEPRYRISRRGGAKGLAYIGGPLVTIHGLGVRVDKLWGNRQPRSLQEPQVIETDEGSIVYKPRNAQIRYRILQGLLLEAKRARRPEKVLLRKIDIAERIHEDPRTVGYSLVEMAEAGVLTYETDVNKTKVTLTKPQHELLLDINAAILKFRLGDPKDMQRYHEKALAILRNPVLVAELIDQSLPAKPAEKASSEARTV